MVQAKKHTQRKVVRRKNTTRNAGMRGVAEAGVGAGLAAAAAGLYYLAGTRRGRKVQRSALDIARDLQHDVGKRVRAVGITSQRAYHRLVDEAAGAYKRASTVDAREFGAAVRKVKSEWRALERNLGSAVKKARRVVKHAAPTRRRGRR